MEVKYSFVAVVVQVVVFAVEGGFGCNTMQFCWQYIAVFWQ